MSKQLHTWKIAVTIPLSVLNATLSIPASVWVTQAIQKLVPTHTLLWETTHTSLWELLTILASRC